ncbi:hypothetical protein HED60_08850 [Planctomycetales bacterium ZRK34]|nr:hypothetical protein HED60_08850 [Planctomycetales bacterium ZRK34]
MLRADDQNLARELEALKAQLQQQNSRIAAQEAELQQMRAAQGDSWLTERRAEEVKTLIRDVLSDADTRASLAEGGMTAGWKDHFFLASEDGNFLLRISGQVQARYVYNQARNPITLLSDDAEVIFNGTSVNLIDTRYTYGDRNVSGFEARRAKIRLDGHVFDPRVTYALQINAAPGSSDDFYMESNAPDAVVAVREFQSPLPDVGRSYDERGGVIFLEDAWIAYEFADGWKARVGQFKGPFMREEAVGSANLATLERSLVNDLFTIDYTQGLGVCYSGELVGRSIRAMGMIHDGSYQSNTAFNRDMTDFAMAARGEMLLSGEWSQFDDQQAWSGGPMGILVGAAIDYELGERGQNSRAYSFSDDVDPQFYIENSNVLKWTVDASFEAPDMYGLSVFAAIVGQHITTNGERLAAGGADQYAFLLQTSVFVIPDKMDVLLRWEHLNLDDLAYVPTTSHGVIDYQLSGLEDNIDMLTFGTNYYCKGNALRVSLDLVWVLDNLPFNASNQGLRATGEDDQFSIRGQVQFLF